MSTRLLFLGLRYRQPIPGKTNHSPKETAGFTLIELLVVIVVYRYFGPQLPPLPTLPRPNGAKKQKSQNLHRLVCPCPAGLLDGAGYLCRFTG